ncbi:uncharacterized protein [Aquarana catesbeiana]|uniref:uncharacterized protein n=1 Tax=Aquarana catesbeiana TaxID=8400 RepID=UPI003CC9682C
MWAADGGNIQVFTPTGCSCQEWLLALCVEEQPGKKPPTYKIVRDSDKLSGAKGHANGRPVTEANESIFDDDAAEISESIFDNAEEISDKIICDSDKLSGAKGHANGRPVTEAIGAKGHANGRPVTEANESIFDDDAAEISESIFDNAEEISDKIICDSDKLSGAKGHANGRPVTEAIGAVGHANGRPVTGVRESFFDNAAKFLDEIFRNYIQALRRNPSLLYTSFQAMDLCPWKLKGNIRGKLKRFLLLLQINSRNIKE